MAVRVEMGGSVMPGRALLLRWRVRGARTGGRVAASWDDKGSDARGGEGCEDTSSALPSKDNDSRNWDDDVEGGGRMDAGELSGVGVPEQRNESRLTKLSAGLAPVHGINGSRPEGGVISVSIQGRWGREGVPPI